MTHMGLTARYNIARIGWRAAAMVLTWDLQKR
jgi:hypothetical protein